MNGKERCIEIYREPVNGRYQTQVGAGEEGVLECAALPDVKVDVGELFAGIAA